MSVSTASISHGSIACVTATVPDLDAALGDYEGRLGLACLSRSKVSEADAASWDAPDIVGHRQAILSPVSEAPFAIRIVEQPNPADFRATTTYGWAAFELTVQNVFKWPQSLAGGGFDIVGPPRQIAGLDHLIAMQMVGTGQEMLYLNEVRDNTPTTDLPKAQSPVDKAFICILAAKHREAAVAWYCEKLALDESETHTIPYSSINRALDLPTDTQTTLTMVHSGRMPIIEVDAYPETATDRPSKAGYLPAGNAIVSLAVRNLDAIQLTPIAPIAKRQATPFSGQRSACYRGAEGELLELIEFPDKGETRI